MKYYAFTEWIWLRPSGIENETMMLRGKPFDRTATFQIEEVERAMDQVVGRTKKHAVRPFRPELRKQIPNEQKSSRVVGEFH